MNNGNIEQCYQTLCNLMSLVENNIEEAVLRINMLGMFSQEAIDAARRMLERELLEISVVGGGNLIREGQRRDTMWLHDRDRTDWKYWPHFENFLKNKKWRMSSVISLDNTTDRIVNLLEPPETGRFRTMGLVLGHVQSGKTSNYTGVIAKAADAGYRFFIVLAGITKALRYQTQKRLQRELLGRFNNEFDVLSPADLDRDFLQGSIPSSAILNNGRPKILVIKKICPVLQRLLNWLESATVSDAVLIIDDEADQASINTGGNRQPVDGEDANGQEDDDASPSRTNGLIRRIVGRFDKVAYVAYTATPFANVFIPPDAVDREAGPDLYPEDFIYALPTPAGYFGAEGIFGLTDTLNGNDREELPIIRHVEEEEPAAFLEGDEEVEIPESLKEAILHFILAGACQAYRGMGDKPATMLIHTSRERDRHSFVHSHVEQYFKAIRDIWRYFRNQDEGGEVIHKLRTIYESDFLPTTHEINDRGEYQAFELPAFQDLDAHILRFVNEVIIESLNSDSDFNIDYESNPGMKLIVIGGNKLSRGLTLEGLLVSYFARPGRQRMYDTLLQMGRWFGYRGDYLDLTRIFTTPELHLQFRDLSLIELDLRQQIQRYEAEGKTPRDFLVPVLSHWNEQNRMIPTNRNKMRLTVTTHISYSASFKETITFPETPVDWMQGNIEAVRNLVNGINRVPDGYAKTGNAVPFWQNVDSSLIRQFLGQYSTEQARLVTSEAILDYVSRQNGNGELLTWTVAIIENATPNDALGTINLGIPGRGVNMISRTRLATNMTSLKRIANREDEQIDMSADELAEAERLKDQYRRENDGKELNHNLAVRMARPAGRGVLLIYPISRYSGHDGHSRTRRPLFENPDASGVDIMGVAFSFPRSDSAETMEYIQGIMATTENV